jgi:choline-phosphate cytidylyltransferase
LLSISCPLLIYVFLFPKLPQGTAIKERIQERLIKAQSSDFGSLLQYDSYDSDEAKENDEDEDEDELFEDVKE